MNPKLKMCTPMQRLTHQTCDAIILGKRSVCGCGELCIIYNMKHLRTTAGNAPHEERSSPHEEHLQRIWHAHANHMHTFFCSCKFRSVLVKRSLL